MSNQQNDKIVDAYLDTHPRRKLTPQQLFEFMGWKEDDEHEPVYRNELA